MGCAVWFSGSWFLSLWKEANEGCPAFMWLGIDGVYILYAKHGCAGFKRFGVGCDSLFLSSLTGVIQISPVVGHAFYARHSPYQISQRSLGIASSNVIMSGNDKAVARPIRLNFFAGSM